MLALTFVLIFQLGAILENRTKRIYSTGIESVWLHRSKVSTGTKGFGRKGESEREREDESDIGQLPNNN